MKSMKKYVALPLLSLVLALPALAQTMTYEDRFRLIAPTSSGQTGLFETVTGDTLQQGTWSFGFYYNNYDWLAAPGTPAMQIPSDRGPWDMDYDEDVFSLSFGYGLTDRWEVSAMIPYVRLEQNSGDLSGFVNGYPYMGDFSESGLGNVRLATKFGLLDPDTYASRLALSLFADLPTGDDDTGIATGGTDYGLGLHWNYRVFSFAGTFKNRGDRGASGNIPRFNTPNEFNIDAGLNIPIRRMGSTNWISEINTVFFDGGDVRPDDAVFLVTGIRHWFGDSGWALNAALRTNATMWGNDNDACPHGGLLGLTYAPVQLAALVAAPPAPTLVPPPPPPAPVAPPVIPVTPPRQPQQLRTDTILFESGSARLTNIAKAILDDVALRMRQEPASTAVSIGYTDDRENTGANRDLDRRRAEAVRDYLVTRHGIDASRITIENLGTQSPVGDNATASGRTQNRRVVIRLMLP